MCRASKRALPPACFSPQITYSSLIAFPLTAYIEAALELARYDKLEDGSFAGEIPKLKGVVAFGRSFRVCENELRSTLEDWILVGLRLGHKLPVLGGIDLNKIPNGRMATTVSCERTRSEPWPAVRGCWKTSRVHIKPT